MIQIEIIILILFNHWLFDFPFQTRNMGNNKSKSMEAMISHVGVYSLGLFIISFVLFPATWVTVGCLWMGINATAHFLTDYVTSRATSAMYKEERFHEFFTIIGIDQMIHAITLFGTYVWLK